MKNFEQVCRLVRQGLDDGAYPSACLSVGIRGSVCVRQTFRPRPGDYAVRHRQPVKDRGHHDDRIPLSGGRAAAPLRYSGTVFPRARRQKRHYCAPVDDTYQRPARPFLSQRGSGRPRRRRPGDPCPPAGACARRFARLQLHGTSFWGVFWNKSAASPSTGWHRSMYSSLWA